MNNLKIATKNGSISLITKLILIQNKNHNKVNLDLIRTHKLEKIINKMKCNGLYLMINL